MDCREKLKAYVERAFRDMPCTEVIQNTKAELMSDLLDHYESCRAKGMSPEQAYQSALGSVGNIFELLDALEGEKMPNILFRSRHAAPMP